MTREANGVALLSINVSITLPSMPKLTLPHHSITCTHPHLHAHYLVLREYLK